MDHQETSRLDFLERRVERLTSVLIIQSVLLAVVLLAMALRTAPIIALCLIVALPLLVFYRRSLPRYAHLIGRMLARMGITPPARSEPDSAMARETPTN